MKEPKIIGLGEAAKLWAEGNGHRLECRFTDHIGNGWGSYQTPHQFQNPCLEWRLLPEAPQVVKPVVVVWPIDEPGLIFNRENTPEAKGDCVLTIRPRAQQDEKDRLEREFVRLCETCYRGDSKIRALRDFIKKEMA